MRDVAALLSHDRRKGCHQKYSRKDPAEPAASVKEIIFCRMKNQCVFLFGWRKPGVKSTIIFSFGNTGAFFS
jgi:hypothetical protein